MDDHTRYVIDLYGIIIGLSILMLIALFVITGGCITYTKTNVLGITPVPTPTPPAPVPTPTPPTPVPTPTPIPTLSKEQERAFMMQTHGYYINEWHQWYREDVSGKKDMIIRAVIYNYTFMPSFHWLDFSWGSRATQKETSYPGNKFLFVFVRMESIGTSETTYGFGPDHFMVQINQTIYAPDDTQDPTRKIRELEDKWTRDHVETPPPYGYKQVQEAGSGIISAEYLEWLKNGEPWDGYLIYQIPADTKPEDIRVLGRFDNVGGSAWWQLE